MAYKVDYEEFTVVEIGDDINMDGVTIRVLSIVKVDLNKRIVWFTGVPVDSLF